MSISLEFQKRLNNLLYSADCNKSELPKLIGVSYSTFSKSVNYGAIPQVKTLIKLADYFDVSIDYLIGKSENEYFERSESPKTFFERLDLLRESKNITFYEMGKQVHLGTNYFAQWQKCNYVPSVENLIILADHFEVSIDYLLGRTD